MSVAQGGENYSDSQNLSHSLLKLQIEFESHLKLQVEFESHLKLQVESESHQLRIYSDTREVHGPILSGFLFQNHLAFHF